MVSREASNLLNTSKVILLGRGNHDGPCNKPESAGWRLTLPFLPPQNGQVEIDPEQDVDDEDGDEGLCNVGHASFSFQLNPDVTIKHNATA